MVSTVSVTDCSTVSNPASQRSKSMPQYFIRSMDAWEMPRAFMCWIICSLSMCCTPQSVWPMTMISSTPSSMMATRRERITLPKGLVTTPPAFLMIFTSPLRSPRAAGRSSTSRVSMQVRMAIFLLGYLLVR